ncbi:FIST C-terminal domain-containing protein [bacterium]|nr:FIST C-terminal domain-containing protein [bacterium]
MHWKSVLSQQASLEAAINECLDRLKDFPEPIDLAFVFVQSAWRKDMEQVSGRLRRGLNARLMLGCTGGGVIGEGLEVEARPALSVTVGNLPGVELHGFYLEDDELPSPDAPPECWREVIGLQGWEATPAFILLADPFEFDLNALLRGLDYAFPRSLKLGGLASDARQPGGNRLILNQQLYSRGLVGLALGGKLKVESVVAQGCRPIGEAMRITRGERNVILEMDGRTPLQVLEKTLGELSQRDRKVAQNSLFLGIRTEPELSVDAILSNRPKAGGDFLIRNLLSLDPRRQALTVGALVRTGQTVQFHLRDAQASAEDLEKMLDRYREQGKQPRGGVLFSCLGRGEHLYKQANHDSEQFRRRFPQAALGGFFCNGEIGPVGDTSYLHGYTSCFALIGPED